MIIINKLNQRIMINLPESKVLNLLAGGSLSITEADSASPHIRALLNKKYVAVAPGPKIDPEQALSRTKLPAADLNAKSAANPAVKPTKGRMKGKGCNK